jgi:hypothetical protein
VASIVSLSERLPQRGQGALRIRFAVNDEQLA